VAKRLALAAVPAVGIVLVTLALILSRQSAPAARIARPPIDQTHKPKAVERLAPLPPQPKRPRESQPSPPEKLARSMEDARIQSTYQNYRTAVATGNNTLEESLRRTLLRDRERALELAEAELARAATSFDRDVAMKTVNSLRSP
jgi:type IV secretory pathway VirB10-like protein